MIGRRFDQLRRTHHTALSLGTQMLEARQMIGEVGEGYYEAWDTEVRQAALREMDRLQEQMDTLREQLARPVEPTLQGRCLTPMSHVGGEDWPCILPALHRRFDEPHQDQHGHYAPLLVHWSTIQEVQRVQDARARGDIT